MGSIRPPRESAWHRSERRGALRMAAGSTGGQKRKPPPPPPPPGPADAPYPNRLSWSRNRQGGTGAPPPPLPRRCGPRRWRKGERHHFSAPNPRALGMSENRRRGLPPLFRPCRRIFSSRLPQKAGRTFFSGAEVDPSTWGTRSPAARLAGWQIRSRLLNRSLSGLQLVRSGLRSPEGAGRPALESGPIPVDAPPLVFAPKAPSFKDCAAAGARNGVHQKKTKKRSHPSATPGRKWKSRAGAPPAERLLARAILLHPWATVNPGSELVSRPATSSWPRPPCRGGPMPLRFPVAPGKADAVDRAMRPWRRPSAARIAEQDRALPPPTTEGKALRTEDCPDRRRSDPSSSRIATLES